MLIANIKATSLGYRCSVVHFLHSYPVLHLAGDITPVNMAERVKDLSLDSALSPVILHRFVLCSIFNLEPFLLHAIRILESQQAPTLVELVVVVVVVVGGDFISIYELWLSRA